MNEIDFVGKDIEMIRDSDIVFCYQEKENPGIANCSFEVGYAVALGKCVIYINEKIKPRKRVVMLIHTSTEYFTDFQAALEHLKWEVER
jgi:nucleoside 2-deoxyribosyltransferase